MLTSRWEATTGEVAAAGVEHFDIEHIHVAQDIDALVIAPATANIIARLAHGLADDLLSTIALSTPAPTVLAPAMNVQMWRHPATQANMDTLRSRGFRIVAPDKGHLACGMVGEGRLAEVRTIADAVHALSQQSRDLVGETLLITAGGTREPIDAVRFLGNRSSGKMGFALAEAALARGAEVILISAAAPPASLPWQVIRVDTAAEMQQTVLSSLPRASAVIMAAAVSDYRIQQHSAHKLKKTPTLTLELTANEDILQHVVHQRRMGTIVIGFAAETERILEEGRRKLREKGVEIMIANDVSQRGSGFDADRNAGILLTREREIPLPSSSKREMAESILDQLKSLRAGNVQERTSPASRA